MLEPTPLPGTHLAQVDCIDCGAVVLAAPQQCDNARCTGCWGDYVKGISGCIQPSPPTPL